MSDYTDKLKRPEWLKFRRELLRNRAHKCERCGGQFDTKSLTVHHGYYRPKGNPWEYEPETLWVLCWPCHEFTQRELVRIHREIGGIRPNDLEDFLGQLGKTTFAFKYGISHEEYLEIVAEEKAIAASMYSDYSVNLTACSDLAPTRAYEARDAAYLEFPGISIEISESDNDPDVNASVDGPDAEIAKSIEYWFEHWR